MIKISELLETNAAMQSLASQRMSAKLAYAFAKNIRLMAPEIETFNETRLKLLKENWKVNEKTQLYDIPPEEQSKWKEMYDELAKQEVTIEPYLIDRAMLDGIQISPAEYIAISWIIKDGE